MKIRLKVSVHFQFCEYFTTSIFIHAAGTETIFISIFTTSWWDCS